MDPRALEALQDPVREFVDFYRDRHPDPERTPPLPDVFGEHREKAEWANENFHYADDEGRYRDFPHLYAEEQEVSDKLASCWRKEKRYKEHFPDQGIEARLKRTIVDCLNEPDRTEEFVARLTEFMEVPPIALVILPVIGINLRLDEYKVAPDVTLLKTGGQKHRHRADRLNRYSLSRNPTKHLAL